MALIYHFSLWLCGRTRLLHFFSFINFSKGQCSCDVFNIFNYFIFKRILFKRI